MIEFEIFILWFLDDSAYSFLNQLVTSSKIFLSGIITVEDPKARNWFKKKSAVHVDCREH